MIEDHQYVYRNALYAQHLQFAVQWDRNLREQGVADVFDPARHTQD